MSTKNILYYYEICGMTIEQIADKVRLPIEQIRSIVSKPPNYPSTYTPRMRYNGWVYGK